MSVAKTQNQQRIKDPEGISYAWLMTTPSATKLAVDAFVVGETAASVGATGGVSSFSLVAAFGFGALALTPWVVVGLQYLSERKARIAESRKALESVNLFERSGPTIYAKHIIAQGGALALPSKDDLLAELLSGFKSNVEECIFDEATKSRLMTLLQQLGDAEKKLKESLRPVGTLQGGGKYNFTLHSLAELLGTLKAHILLGSILSTAEPYSTQSCFKLHLRDFLNALFEVAEGAQDFLDHPLMDKNAINRNFQEIIQLLKQFAEELRLACGPR